MNPRGVHVVIDREQCGSDLLNDAAALAYILEKACRDIGATVLVGPVVHKFDPQGVTVLLLLGESHASIHTYPEAHAYQADIFTCGGIDPEPAAKFIAEALGGVPTERIRTIKRG